MKVFSTGQIKEIDTFTIKNEPITSIDLMERAATACANWIADHFSINRPIRYFAGPGNNGGDAWAIARLLARRGFSDQQFFLLKLNDSLSSDSEINKERLIKQQLVKIHTILSENDFPVISNDDLLIDGLFGSGLSRPLDGLAAQLVQYLNKSESKILSIDIPSGLAGEENSPKHRKNSICADITLSFQFPKLSFFFSENENKTGEWHILQIGLHPSIINKLKTDRYYLLNEDIKPIIPNRKKFSHKGTYGHALLIAGSYGMMGAAVLASKACLKTGAGLNTCHIPVSGVQIIQTAVPESLVSIDESDKLFTKIPELASFNAIGIGPAITCNNSTEKALKTLLESAKVPLVIDADAITMIGKNKEWFSLIPQDSILTPHPKEFEKIAGESGSDYERNQQQLELAAKYSVYIVLKGAYTSIACPNGKCYFNSTGNPGMATAGSGDVLTGIVLSLLAQGYSSKNAALAGVFIHGMAGDIARSKIGEHALIASDIINNIGPAFQNIIAV